MNSQHTTVDVHFTAHFTRHRSVGFRMALSWHLLVHTPDVTVQMRFLSEFPRALVTLEWPLSSVASLVAL